MEHDFCGLEIHFGKIEVFLKSFYGYFFFPLKFAIFVRTLKSFDTCPFLYSCFGGSSRLTNDGTEIAIIQTTRTKYRVLGSVKILIYQDSSTLPIAKKQKYIASPLLLSPLAVI